MGLGDQGMFRWQGEKSWSTRTIHTVCSYDKDLKDTTNCIQYLSSSKKVVLTIRTQSSPDVGSLTRLKMVPGLSLMLKHRASFLSGSSIMK